MDRSTMDDIVKEARELTLAGRMSPDHLYMVAARILREGGYCRDIFTPKDDLYMRRWLLGPKDGDGLRLHCICLSDSDRHLHDHPFDFTTTLLVGSYKEHLADGSVVEARAGDQLVRKAEDFHRLELPIDPDGWPIPVWTLVIRGPYRRTWGFQTAGGWVPFFLYAQQAQQQETK